MKKILLFTAACAIFFGSCAQDDSGNTAGRQNLRFNIVAVDPFLVSRAADIYSSDALQAIEDVHVHVFKTTDGGANFVYHRSYDLSLAWSRGNNSVTHDLNRDEMLEDGSYRFLAVGVDGPTDYTVSTMTQGVTNYNDVIATLSGTTPQEIFAGYTDNVIDTSVERITILMTRRVSGTLAYFSNVPTTIGTQTVRYLRMTLAGSNTALNITSAPNNNTTPAAATGAGYNIFNVDLSTQGQANGIYTGTPEIGGVQKAPNSTLVGAYIVPVAITSGAATMVVSLVGTDGTTVLKTWTVRNEQNNPTFNIVSNHFYSVGRKLQASNTQNGTPDDPSDDDTPIDLSKSQTIIANISAGWDTVHQMNITDVTPAR